MASKTCSLELRWSDLMAKRTVSEALREEWKESFADYIKTKRHRHGLSQLGLARRVGVNQTMISKLEKAGYERPFLEQAGLLVPAWSRRWPCGAQGWPFGPPPDRLAFPVPACTD